MSSVICRGLSLYTLFSHSWVTFKVLKHRAPRDPHLLKFWVIYSMLTLYEAYMEPLVSIVPFYYTFKLVCILYIATPAFNGIDIVYEKLFKPKMKELENKMIKFVIPKLTRVQRSIQGDLDSFFFHTITVENLTNDELSRLKQEYTTRLGQIRAEQASRNENGFNIELEPIENVAATLGSISTAVTGLYTGLSSYLESRRTKSKSSEEFEDILTEIDNTDKEIEEKFNKSVENDRLADLRRQQTDASFQSVDTYVSESDDSDVEMSADSDYKERVQAIDSGIRRRYNTRQSK